MTKMTAMSGKRFCHGNFGEKAKVEIPDVDVNHGVPSNVFSM